MNPNLIECGYVARFCGCPGTGCDFEPRYVIPALASVLGNTAVAWQAACWATLSSTPRRENFLTGRTYWRLLFTNARTEFRLLTDFNMP